MIYDIDNKSDREDYEFYNAYDFPELFEDKLTFGMYINKTYDWVYQNDYNYFEWLIKNNKKSHKYLNHTLKKHGLKIDKQNNKIIKLYEKKRQVFNT